MPVHSSPEKQPRKEKTGDQESSRRILFVFACRMQAGALTRASSSLVCLFDNVPFLRTSRKAARFKVQHTLLQREIWLVMSTDAELERWIHQAPPRDLHRVSTTANAEGCGFSTSPWPSSGCARCQAVLILMLPTFLKSYGKEEQGLTEQCGFSRAHRHLLAASSDSLPSKLTAPDHVPTFISHASPQLG